MPINPLYDPLSEQLMPAQRWLDTRDMRVTEDTEGMTRGMLQRAMQPPWQAVPQQWQMVPSQQQEPQDTLPMMSQEEISSLIQQPRPEQRILGTLGGMEGPKGGELPAVEPAPDYQPPQRDISGFGGLGNWEEVPMGPVPRDPAMYAQSQPRTLQKEDLPPEGKVSFENLERPKSSLMEPSEPILDDRIAQTTLAKRAGGMGWDPRRFIAAMAQMSGEVGNIRGKPIASTAPAYYEQMIDEEQQQRENDMKMEEMAQRFAPKPMTPEQIIDMRYKQAMIDRMTSPTGFQQKKELLDIQQMNALELAKQKADAELRKRAADLIGRQKAPAKPTGEKDTQRAFKNASELRKEYQANPITKRTFEVQSQWDKVKAVLDNPSAAGDMAAIFMFMKTLDPGSTVREGEYKAAAEATSALGRVETYAQNVAKGSKLNDQQRADFKNVMEKFYRAQMKEQARLDAQFTDLATRSGISPQDLMIRPAEGGTPAKKVKSVDELLGAK